MNNLATINTNAVAEYDPQLIETLRNSLYPGAKDESIRMVIDYCRHANLDVMQKPVHIVPMWVKDAKTGQGAMRDVPMHSIGYYRIQASRSGCAGISEPEFGEDVTECLGGTDVTYPKWCRVTVKRMIGGLVVEFSSKEFWKENYATIGKTGTPNSMWQKRPYGQLGKCAESQALRKGFPEIGTMPTAEEMQGKHLEESEYEEIKKLPARTATDKLKAKLGMKNEAEQFDDVDDVNDVNDVDDVDDVDPLTGEVFDDDMDGVVVNVESLTFMMEAAPTMPALLDVAAKTKELSKEEKAAMRVVFKRCELALKGKG